METSQREGAVTKGRWAMLLGLLTLAAVVGLTLMDDGSAPMIGIYTWGPEVNTFRSCGGAEVRWVQAPADLLSQLRGAHQSLTSEPYQGIFVAAYLRHSGYEPEGFALRYDGLVHVDSVRSISAEVPTNCLDTTWALPGRRPTYFPR
jgi:hypothetical protein